MKCLAIAALLILSVCCKPTPTIIYPPPPPKIEEPRLRYKTLTKDASLEQLTIALTLDVMELEATLKKALEYLNGVRPPVQPQGPQKP